MLRLLCMRALILSLLEKTDPRPSCFETKIDDFPDYIFNKIEATSDEVLNDDQVIGYSEKIGDWSQPLEAKDEKV